MDEELEPSHDVSEEYSQTERMNYIGATYIAIVRNPKKRFGVSLVVGKRSERRTVKGTS